MDHTRSKSGQNQDETRTKPRREQNCSHAWNKKDHRGNKCIKITVLNAFSFTSRQTCGAVESTDTALKCICNEVKGKSIYHKIYLSKVKVP